MAQHNSDSHTLGTRGARHDAHKSTLCGITTGTAHAHAHKSEVRALGQRSMLKVSTCLWHLTDKAIVAVVCAYILWPPDLELENISGSLVVPRGPSVGPKHQAHDMTWAHDVTQHRTAMPGTTRAGRNVNGLGTTTESQR